MYLPGGPSSATEVIAVPAALANLSRDAFGATVKLDEDEAIGQAEPSAIGSGTLQLGPQGTSPFNQQDLRAALSETAPVPMRVDLAELPTRPVPPSSGPMPVAPPQAVQSTDNVAEGALTTLDEEPDRKRRGGLFVKLVIVALLIAAVVSTVLLRKRLRRWLASQDASGSAS